MAVIERLTEAVSPSAGAVVMATGVVSLCFSAMGMPWLSRLLFAAATLTWIVLVAVYATRVLTNPARCLAQVRCPAALTLVAGTAVLGSRLAAAGRPGYAQGLLAVGVVLWVALLPPVFGRWPTPTAGTGFLACVAPQSLAVLAARLARVSGQRWEMYAAAAFAGLGLLFYGVVVSRFDFRQVAAGEGDQWVLGGALAISALAGVTLFDTFVRLGAPGAARGALHLLTFGLGWAAAVAYVPLAVAEAIRPRLRFDMRRWSTVFPLGMASLASLEISHAFHQGMLRDLGQALSWVALAVWSIVAAGTLRCARNLAAGSGRQE